MAPEVYNISQTPITSHAFSADHKRESRAHSIKSTGYLTQEIQSEVAVSLNSNDAQIFSRQGSEWVATETLAEVCIDNGSGLYSNRFIRSTTKSLLPLTGRPTPIASSLHLKIGMRTCGKKPPTRKQANSCGSLL